jgi:hypothetical protein
VVEERAVFVNLWVGRAGGGSGSSGLSLLLLFRAFFFSWCFGVVVSVGVVLLRSVVNCQPSSYFYRMLFSVNAQQY